MNTLAFDTCFGACSVAASWRVGARAGIVSRFERLQRGHAELLAPMIEAVMGEAPFDFDALELIVVTTGPGTFTGQRVGIAAARALALATGARVGTLSSLAVMAYTAREELGADVDGRAIAVAVDARRGEVYFQRFAGPDLEPTGPPELVRPHAAVPALDGETIIVGSGAEQVVAEARALGTSAVARLAVLEPDVRTIPAGTVAPAAAMPRPLYLRAPDAVPQERPGLARVP
ncbi:MAG: tRNA (adenosine(37)-N6)-threonylcarbamoyltransferase complex dimerization subunit type 1 TsaB [Hyphomicrobium sp.]|uniref:tRNA (adenosine(37)-N6)-threonylcarbamoyltransferase complex dimerization subunit type 1 TsaB n=1 Tax=Hyphomicrobium sp. TaxID=82 RepID=UPI003D0BDD0E